MKRIEGTKSVILDQIWDNTYTNKYVSIKDLVAFFEQGLEQAKKSRKPYPKEYLKGYKKAIEQTIVRMKDLLGEDSTPMNIPNRLIKEDK